MDWDAAAGNYMVGEFPINLGAMGHPLRQGEIQPPWCKTINLQLPDPTHAPICTSTCSKVYKRLHERVYWNPRVLGKGQVGLRGSGGGCEAQAKSEINKSGG